MRYASAHSSFARSNWPSTHDASPAVISAPARPTVGEPAVSASRNDAAYSRAVRFLPRMCQYIHRSPHICRPASQAAASPSRAAARSVSSAAWRLPSSAMPRSSGSDLIGALDAVADLRARAPRTGGRASARPRASRPRPRGARARTRRSSAASGAGRPGRPPARAPCRRATPARRGRSRRDLRRRPRRPRTCTLRRRRPCAGTGAAPTPSRSEWLQSIVARSVCCRSGVSRGPDVSTSRAWSSRSSSASGDRSRSRAAASSSASGRPSRRRQTAATASAFSGVSSNEPLVVVARSTNSATPDTRERLGRAPTRRELERGERVLPLGGDPERCPARGHDPQPRAALDQTGHLRSGRHDLLEVVEEQERLLVADQRDDALAERPPLGLLHVQRVRESGEELRGVGDVGQRDERDTVQELGREQPAELDDDARLSDAARDP